MAESLLNRVLQRAGVLRSTPQQIGFGRPLLDPTARLAIERTFEQSRDQIPQSTVVEALANDRDPDAALESYLRHQDLIRRVQELTDFGHQQRQAQQAVLGIARDVATDPATYAGLIAGPAAGALATALSRGHKAVKWATNAGLGAELAASAGDAGAARPTSQRLIERLGARHSQGRVDPSIFRRPPFAATRSPALGYARGGLVKNLFNRVSSRPLATQPESWLRAQRLLRGRGEQPMSVYRQQLINALGQNAADTYAPASVFRGDRRAIVDDVRDFLRAPGLTVSPGTVKIRENPELLLDVGISSRADVTNDLINSDQFRDAFTQRLLAKVDDADDRRLLKNLIDNVEYLDDDALGDIVDDFAEITRKRIDEDDASRAYDEALAISAGFDPEHTSLKQILESSPVYQDYYRENFKDMIERLDDSSAIGDNPYRHQQRLASSDTYDDPHTYTERIVHLPLNTVADTYGNQFDHRGLSIDKAHYDLFPLSHFRMSRLDADSDYPVDNVEELQSDVGSFADSLFSRFRPPYRTLAKNPIQQAAAAAIEHSAATGAAAVDFPSTRGILNARRGHAVNENALRKIYDEQVPEYLEKIKNIFGPEIANLRSVTFRDPEVRSAIIKGELPGYAEGGLVRPQVPKGESLRRQLLPLQREHELANNLPPGILDATAHYESRYDPTAVGPRTRFGRAQGLYQFMPPTARQFGVNPFDPFAATSAAAAYQRYLFDRFNDPYAALVAWNWGQGNVARSGVDKAPRESRDFANRVLRRIQSLNAEAPITNEAPPPMTAALPVTEPPGLDAELSPEMLQPAEIDQDLVAGGSSQGTGRGPSIPRPPEPASFSSTPDAAQYLAQLMQLIDDPTKTPQVVAAMQGA